MNNILLIIGDNLPLDRSLGTYGPVQLLPREAHIGRDILRCGIMEIRSTKKIENNRLLYVN